MKNNNTCAEKLKKLSFIFHVEGHKPNLQGFIRLLEGFPFWRVG